jgi:hypothetical protein
MTLCVVEADHLAEVVTIKEACGRVNETCDSLKEARD